uniref:BED-type domain-containing protein n=1 Tax=Leptobrachium leishanense TaxID=445787 RepID=A0A8C5MXQ7_9ANUR
MDLTSSVTDDTPGTIIKRTAPSTNTRSRTVSKGIKKTKQLESRPVTVSQDLPIIKTRGKSKSTRTESDDSSTTSQRKRNPVPPSKQVKTTSSSSSSSFTGTAAELKSKTYLSESRTKSALLCQQFKELVPLPPKKTTCTITSATCRSTSTLAGAAGATATVSKNVLVPEMFYSSRGTKVSGKVFESHRSFKQPKTELLQYQEGIALALSQSATTTTTTAAAGLDRRTQERDTGGFLSHPLCPSSSLQGEGIQRQDSTSPTGDVFLSSHKDYNRKSHLKLDLQEQEELQPYTPFQGSLSPYHSTHDRSPILFSCENSSASPVSPVSVSSQVEIISTNIKICAPFTSATTTTPVVGAPHPTIPKMFKNNKHGLQQQGETESTATIITSECTGQVQRVELDEECGSKQDPSSAAATSGRRRSNAWQYFTESVDKRTAKCNLCGTWVSRGQQTNKLTTTGMNSHLKTHHKAVLLALEIEKSSLLPALPASSASTTRKSTTTTSATGTHTSTSAAASKIQSKQPSSTQPTMEQFGGFQPRGISKQQTRKVTRLIAELITVGGASFNLIGGDSFKRLMQALSPQYKVPSRTTFSRSVVPAMYRSCVGVLKEELGKAAGRSVHFTTDLWTAPNSQHAFLSLTGHWWQSQPNVPEQNLKQPAATSSGSKKKSAGPCADDAEKTALHSFLLHAEVMDQQHTAENILHALKNMMAQWLGEQSGTQAKMGFVVTDGGSNMTKALRDGRFVGVRCAAHILHLVVTKALDESISGGSLGALVESCRKIAGHFHHSARASHLLRQEQKTAGLPEHRLKQDVPLLLKESLHSVTIPFHFGSKHS